MMKILVKVGNLMDRSRTMPRLCFALTAVLTVMGVVLRTVCMLTSFDADVGYFTEGILSTLSTVLYFLAVISLSVCAALIPGDTLPTRLHTRLRLPVALLWGLSLAVFTVISLVVCFPARTGNLMVAPTILGLLSSTYFLVSGKRSGRYPDWLCLIGFLPVLWCISAVAETYMDPFTVMNSPVKVGLQLGFIGLMFILISELRFRLSKPLPRVAVALMGIGVFLALNGSIPVLAGIGSHALSNVLHLLYAVVLLCGGLYGLYTLLWYTCFPAPTDATEDEPDSDAPDAPDHSTAK